MELELLGITISIAFIIYGLFLLLLDFIQSRKCNNPPIKRNSTTNYAILIPARDESRVIESILESIKNQTKKIPMEDVYVIVESNKDKTVEITKKYNSTVIVRKELEKRRKGYALDEAITWIREHNKKYDAYFIFDADNVLDKNYLKEMTKSFEEGYDIGIGYRNCKNGNDSVVSACSALTFSMINTLGNESKKRHTKTLTISGTGFYIRGTWIDKWKCYPFHTLTEDYELTLYATVNKLTTTYNTKAIFYDEQPVKLKSTIPQRTRWIKGFFSSRKKYLPKIKEELNKKDNNYGSNLSAYLGVKPYISMVIGVVFLLLTEIIKLCISPSKITLFIIFGIIILIYLVLLLATLYMLKKEKLRLNLSFNMKIKALLYNPFYLSTYVYCALKALFHKNIEWSKVEHGNN